MQYNKSFIDDLKTYIKQANFAPTFIDPSIWCYSKTFNLSPNHKNTLTVKINLSYEKEPALFIKINSQGFSDKWLQIKDICSPDRWWYLYQFSHINFFNLYIDQETILRNGFHNWANEYMAMLKHGQDYTVTKRSISLFDRYAGYINIPFKKMTEQNKELLLNDLIKTINHIKYNFKKNKTNQRLLERYERYLSHLNKDIAKTNPALAQLNDLFN